MKAVIISKYGGNEVVEVNEMPMPTPGPSDVLIRVHAASINPIDWKIRSGYLRLITGFRFPKMLGGECAGEVVETGSLIKYFRKGDQVIGLPGMKRMGAFAEYACADEKATFSKPQNISFGQAASIPVAGLTALQALRDRGKISARMRVLVNGASGGVGHFAVQIAKIFGAHVTVVCSAANAEMVKDLGADAVIDYAAADFTQKNDRYDIIFDAVAKSSFGKCASVLTPKGVYISTLPALSIVVNGLLGVFGGKKARSIWVRPNKADMEWMKAQIEAGRIRIVIDKAYSLDQAKDALSYSESGRVKGKIVFQIL